MAERLIPKDFERRMGEVHGEAGLAWIASLPELTRTLAERWDVILDPPFPGLSYAWVAPGIRGGQPVVLKVAVPTEESLRQPLALRAYAGRGAVRVLEVDLMLCAVLLERLCPGEILLGHPDAAVVACSVMQELWAASAPAHFPRLKDWTRSLDGAAASSLPTDLVEKARDVRNGLLESEGEPVLLNADVHHFNILSSGREWRAIDPKGVVGEREFECAAFLINAFPGGGLSGVVQDIDTFSRRLRLDRRRISKWAFVFGLLSAAWTLEDHGEIDSSAIEFARAIESLF